jgi:hypothetical protein
VTFFFLMVFTTVISSWVPPVIDGIGVRPLQFAIRQARFGDLSYSTLAETEIKHAEQSPSKKTALLPVQESKYNNLSLISQPFDFNPGDNAQLQGRYI